MQYFVEKQLCLNEEDPNGLVVQYSDIFIQLGYVMFFAQAFPLAPLLSIFCNLLQLKSTMNNLSYYSQRFQALPANGIGQWV